MNNKRWLWGVGVLILAAVLALGLQYLAYDLIIAPLAYTWWLLKGFLQVVPELAYWWTAVTMLLLAALRALFRRLQPEKLNEKPESQQDGAVAQLAFQIERVGQGNYFKWAVAKRLAELAYALLQQRGSEEADQRRVLKGPQWSPSQRVQAYLETGLRTSFIQLPRRRFWFWFWYKPEKTPLDIDVEPVIEYLESQMEMKN